MMEQFAVNSAKWDKQAKAHLHDPTFWAMMFYNMQYPLLPQ
jgi:hypothetical protein